MKKTKAGKFTANMVIFTRLCRAMGLGCGPASSNIQLEALEAVTLGNREDFRAVLKSIFVTKKDQIELFNLLFDRFWRSRLTPEKLASLLTPALRESKSTPERAGARRLQEIFSEKSKTSFMPEKGYSAEAMASGEEILQHKDFAQMTAEEIKLARQALNRLSIPRSQYPLRRYRPSSKHKRVDLKNTINISRKYGFDIRTFAWREPKIIDAPIVALCDISGSMSDYSRIFVHFLHCLASKVKNFNAYLFATKLTNITRALRHRDIDEALKICGTEVGYWDSGTRIGPSLHEFNHYWSRRVLSSKTIFLLLTDGLERGDTDELIHETSRIQKSVGRLIWLNPLLRYDKYQPTAAGNASLLPCVDEMLPIHNLCSVADLLTSLTHKQKAATH